MAPVKCNLVTVRGEILEAFRPKNAPMLLDNKSVYKFHCPWCSDLYNIFIFRLEGERLKGKEEDMDEEMDEGEDHIKGMLYTIYSFILHQQRLRAQEQLAAGASSLTGCRLASSPPPPPALCSPTSPVDWDRLRQPVSFHLEYKATLQ
jgi:hypothetical protein